MSRILGVFVSRFWWLCIIAWLAAVVALHQIAPRWDDVTHDGDLAYLPAGMPSIEGELLLAKAFPEQKAKSQIAIIVEEPTGKLTPAELDWIDSLAEKFEQLKNELPIVDVWSRTTQVVGEKLTSRYRPPRPGKNEVGQASVIVLQLSNELMATNNVVVLKRVQEVIDEARHQPELPETLRVGVSGSAAIGGDMLTSIAESIHNTEVATVGLVVIILLLVYRAPLLALIPLITIGISLVMATDLLALLAAQRGKPGLEWFNYKIFTTTKIFIIVILFGAGTDFCLFLISRFKEELDRGLNRAEAVRAAVTAVTGALVGSACTTVFGLGMMFFADFGKFSSSGPGLGLALLVTLLACLTLAPALVRACGPAVFWPFSRRAAAMYDKATGAPLTRTSRFWDRVAGWIMAHPGAILIASVLILSPLAYEGMSVDITYNYLHELASERPSVQGTEMSRRHFPAGETAPITVLALKKGAQFDEQSGQNEIANLTRELAKIAGVESVRSITDPLGQRRDKPTKFRLRKLVVRKHKLTEERFLAQTPAFKGDVTRLDLIFKYDPFSRESIDTLHRLDERLEHLSSDESSFWHKTRFATAGTTVGIRDLSWVTTSDRGLIQKLVILAVLAVLIVLLRKPFVSVYLMLSVLFSYYVTIGATELVCQYVYGAGYEGLDWKVPIFLFVILVAVGEDYNIYLVTRVLEEQERLGKFAGIRRAVACTGGIITSCGVIMAGTFVSMMAGTVRSMLELGFALSIGIMLDTCIVRPILVPCFLTLVERFFGHPKAPEAPQMQPAMRSIARDRVATHG